MLVNFEISNSDGPLRSVLFKANSKRQVAAYIQKKIRANISSKNVFLSYFLNGFTPYCCRNNRICFYKYNKEETPKAIAKFILSLSADEFLEVLSHTHTHSGGDNYMYSIDFLGEEIDITNE
jgi:hypothetical protein